nr:ictacalcin-like [Nerophis lumbriciformis]
MSQPPKLICGMVLLQECFYEHAKKSGDPKTITKGDFAEMLRKDCCMDVKDADKKKSFFESLDSNGDGVIDFTEFCVLMASFMMMMESFTA